MELINYKFYFRHGRHVKTSSVAISHVFKIRIKLLERVEEISYYNFYELVVSNIKRTINEINRY